MKQTGISLLTFVVSVWMVCAVVLQGCSSSERKREFSLGPLSMEDLRSTEYINQFVANGKAQLDTGVYRERLPESLSEIVVRLSDHVAFGKVGGKDAAAAIVITSPGGYGAFNDLALVVKDSGRVRNTSTQFIGDRVRIDSLIFRGDSIRVDMLTHRSEDPMGSPTLKATRRYRIQADTLVAVGDTLGAR